MRTEKLEIYSFDELSNDAKVVAIESIRQDYYSYNDFSSWAVDDCALFEPLQKELDLIGFNSSKGFLIENTREAIYFNTDRNSFLDCTKAMKITDDTLFLKWLGIDLENEDFKDIFYSFYTANNRNSNTTIEFDNYLSKNDNLIENATKKFDNHIQSVLKRIENDIDYRFTDEAITEDILSNDYEFLKSGKQKLWKII